MKNFLPIILLMIGVYFFFMKKKSKILPIEDVEEKFQIPSDTVLNLPIEKKEVLKKLIIEKRLPMDVVHKIKPQILSLNELNIKLEKAPIEKKEIILREVKVIPIKRIKPKLSLKESANKLKELRINLDKNRTPETLREYRIKRRIIIKNLRKTKPKSIWSKRIPKPKLPRIRNRRLKFRR